MAEKTRTDLTEAGKRALVIILEDGTVARQTNAWWGSSERKILLQTVLALYDRCLVKIVISRPGRRIHRRDESRRNVRYSAMLSEIGAYAARAVKLDLDAEPGRKFPITHEGSLMVTGSLE